VAAEEEEEDGYDEDIECRFGPAVMYSMGSTVAGIYTKDIVWQMEVGCA